MKIARIAIDRPVTSVMFYVAIVLLGFISLRQLSVDLLPNVSYPRLSVLTQYPGVAPEEVETLVTARLEAGVSRIPGLRRVESVSKEGVSFMTLEFAWGTDMDFTLLHTREALDSARYSLPEGISNPTIIPMDPQSKPILVLAISGESNLLELKGFAEELVKPRLEQIEGIGSAEITGGIEREIQVELNPGLLALYGLTVDDVARRIDAFNEDAAVRLDLLARGVALGRAARNCCRSCATLLKASTAWGRRVTLGVASKMFASFSVLALTFGFRL